MNHSTRTPDEGRLSSAGHHDVDELFRQYFQSALPKHWPECPQTAEAIQVAPKRSRFRFVHSYRRLALVAATLGLIVGYHALVGSLPDAQSPLGTKVDSSQPIGMRLMPGKISGGKASAIDVELDPKQVVPKK